MLAVCVLGTALGYVHRLGPASLVPALVADLGIGYAAAGTLMAAYFWTYMPVQVPLGVLTDRLGARRTMLLSLAVLGAGVAVFPLAQTFAGTLAARLLVGLGCAGFWLPSLRLITEWFPPAERARATGLCSAGGGAGGALALLAFPWLAGAAGWRWAYAATLVPWLAMLVLTLAYIRSPAVAERSTAPAAGAAAALAKVLRTPAMWALSAAALCSYAAFVGLVTWLPAFLVERQGAPASAGGLAAALLTGATMVSWPLTGLLVDRLGRRTAIYCTSQALGALGCLAVAALDPGAGAAPALALALVTGLALGGMVLPFVAIPDLLPPALVGTAAGVMNTCWLFGGLAAPMLLGRLLDRTASFSAVFVACAALAAAAAACAPLARDPGPARGRAR